MPLNFGCAALCAASGFFFSYMYLIEKPYGERLTTNSLSRYYFNVDIFQKERIAMTGCRKKETNRQRCILAVLTAFFCIGIWFFGQSITVSAKISWGEKALRRYADAGFKRGVTVYQKITSDGYTLTLADEIPGISVRLTLTMENGMEYYHDWIKGQDYFSAGEICLDFEVFDNLLGVEGFFLGLNPWGWMYERGYYAVTEGKLVLMADSFGGKDDYARDIDGDGENELLCNVIWGDGAYRGVVYDYADGQIYVGNMEDLLDEPYDDFGVGSFGCEFLGEENVARIWFWKEALGDYEEKKYEVDLEKIEMKPYKSVFDVPTCFEWESQ